MPFSGLSVTRLSGYSLRAISELMFWISIATATELKPPSGMMTSA